MTENKKIWAQSLPGYDNQAALDAAVEALFRALPAAERIRGSRVLLKPNLLGKHPPEQAVTTHPAVVRAVIRAVKQRGAAQVVLADSAGGMATVGIMRGIYRASGMEQVCAEEGVELWLGDQSGQRKTNGKLVREFTLLQPVLDADFIIDLPKLKTHEMMGITCAAKNLFGCVPGLQKAEWHMRFPQKERFADMLIDLLGTVRPDMAVVDAITTLCGEGPTSGAPCFMGLLLAGEDMLNLDLAACVLTGMEPMQVPYLAAAQARGLCDKQFDPAAWQAEPVLLAATPGFRLPTTYTGTDFSGHLPRSLHWAVPGVERWLSPRPVVLRSRCIGCGKCAEICPQDTITVKGKAKIHSKKCIHCFCCHEMCPVHAIEIRRFGLFQKA